MLHDPPAMLLAEPIGDVDRESAGIISVTISELAEHGKAVLLTTFGHPGSLEICSRLAYLEDGGLLPSPAAAAKAGEESSSADGHAIRHIAARREERVLLFAPQEIRCAYAQDKDVLIQTASGARSVSFTLAELDERLTDESFFRCHRSFLVNLDWIREIAAWTRDRYSLILKDGKEIPLSKHRAAELRKQLGW
jgi:ABC-2 type transport system ATP-binding protein